MAIARSAESCCTLDLRRVLNFDHPAKFFNPLLRSSVSVDAESCDYASLQSRCCNQVKNYLVSLAILIHSVACGEAKVVLS